MLYPKNNTPKLSEELFKNPTSEYRCTPFWAWNCDLKADELTKEIEFMKEMGMGGFHMHTRVGMSTTYLSDEYMALANTCNEKAKKEDMLCWLYDEDKWPSGFAGGYVTKNEEYRNTVAAILNSIVKTTRLTNYRNGAVTKCHHLCKTARLRLTGHKEYIGTRINSMC